MPYESVKELGSEIQLQIDREKTVIKVSPDSTRIENPVVSEVARTFNARLTAINMRLHKRTLIPLPDVSQLKADAMDEWVDSIREDHGFGVPA
jgi:hypothetical protein